MTRHYKSPVRRRHSRRLRFERIEARLLLTTFTVDSVLDTPDANPGDGISADVSGNSTLRAAIEEANSKAGADRIEFNIPGVGPHTIQPLSALPTVTDPGIIDGTTEPDFAGLPVVEIDGSLAGLGADGLHITVGGSTVRGLAINRFQRHATSFIGGNGIVLETNGGNTIEGNFIGTDVTGTLDFGNERSGVHIQGSANNVIGTNGDGVSDARERNIISGNAFSGVEITGTGSNNNVVAGNYIGTDATGTAALGNRFGVTLTGTGMRVGTNADGVNDAAERNIISGSTFDGVLVFGSNSTIAGNHIGTDVTGTLPIPNAHNGVFVQLASGHAIGGAAPGAGNVIAFNGGNGVLVAGSSTVNNRIAQNSIFSNGALGIDLSTFTPANGVTLNDPGGDGDSGPNNLQNFPVLTSVISIGGNTTIQGTLNSTPSTTFKLEFFSNVAADPSGFGEGQTFVGSTDVVTDGSGNGNILLTVPLALTGGQFVTATATDSAGNTSEFSFAVPVSEVAQPIDVDIKPGNQQNKLNYKKQGVISVAVYTTTEFNAASVDVDTIRLAGIEADGFALQDVDDDGDLDLILHFAVQDLLDALALDLDPGDEESVNVGLTGKTVDDVLIQGDDTVNVFFRGNGNGKT